MIGLAEIEEGELYKATCVTEKGNGAEFILIP